MTVTELEAEEGFSSQVTQPTTTSPAILTLDRSHDIIENNPTSSIHPLLPPSSISASHSHTIDIVPPTPHPDLNINRFSLPPTTGVYTNANSLAPSARTSASFTHVDHSSMDNPDQQQPTTVTMAEVGPGLQLSTQPHMHGQQQEIQLEPHPHSPSQQPPSSFSPPSPSAHQPAASSTNPSSNPAAIPQTPQVTLCFLTVSGRRRVMSFDPEMTIGRVKELVWNAWPGEWEDERPPAPSYLRILYLGKILQNEDTLSKLSFPVWSPPTAPPDSSTDSPPHPPQPQPTIVHLSIRPFAPDSSSPNDGDGLKKKKGSRFGRGSSGVGASDGGQGGNGTGAGTGTGTGDAGAQGGGVCGCGCIIC